MKKVILIIALLVLPLGAYADKREYRNDRNYREHHGRYHFWNKVDRRLERQFNRIERGIQNGELTRIEAKRLHHQHRKLDKRINRIRHKHWIGHSDRRNVRARLNEASDRIHRLKNNDRYRKDHYRHDRYYKPGYRNDKNIAWSNNHSAGFFFRF